MGLIAGMDTEGLLSLSGILRAHVYRRKHHSTQAILCPGYQSSVYRYVVAQNRVGQIREMEVVGLGGSPRQEGNVVVKATGRREIAHAQVYGLVHLCVGAYFEMMIAGG